MDTVYLTSLLVGGGLALLSVFGDFLDADAPDADLDMDFEADLDAEADFSTGSASGPSAGIFSLRALIYTVFGFGGVGSALVWTGQDPTSPVTVSFAVLGGLVVGAVVGVFLRYLKRSDTGSRPGDATYTGMTGRVTLPIGPESPGQIVVTRGAREHTMRALPHRSATDDVDPEGWTRVVVVEVRDGIARVGPMSDAEEKLLP